MDDQTPLCADPGAAAGLPASPSREEAMLAVRTLIAWAGDDPAREGLRDTPRRVVDAFGDWFSGYRHDPAAVLARSFENVANYDDMVLVRGIEVESHCEHHLAPVLGTASLAYIPDGRIVGLSKLARTVEILARRLQTQETLTAQIAATLDRVLRPAGVAVLVDAAHQCMTTRGVRHRATSTVTTRFTGAFAAQSALRDRFVTLSTR